MNERGNYFRIARDQWQDFYTPGNTPLTQAELDNIKSLNDQISMKDVADVYVPLCHLIHLYMKDFESLTLSKGLFLHRYVKMPPLLSGSPVVWLSEKVPPLVYYRPCWTACSNTKPFN